MLLAQAVHHTGRSHGADAQAEATGHQEQGKAQIGVEPLARQHPAGRPIGEIGNVAANLGEVRTEGPRELREAKRGGPRFLAPAISERTHCQVADTHKFFQTAAEVLKRAVDAR